MSFFSRAFSTLARVSRTPKGIPSLWSEFSHRDLDNVPSVTMFLRKDHHLFMGEDGQRRFKNLEESYKHAETKGKATRLSIPFYLPHSIGLQDFKLNSNSGFIPGDVYAQSCFSLLINDRPCKEQAAQLNVLTISGTSRPELKTNDNASYYRCITESHVRNSDMEEPRRIERCSFVHGCDGMRIPQRTMIDEFFLSDKNKEGPSIAVPFKFNVSVATDEELRIDDEWSMIKDWANRKA
jgi:hypothetical protein